ncbi:ATP-dependent DNA helicase [Thermomicrobium sp. 4228-Ro]|uniref:ATP-dependent helicase n=1 Tax=Thermomicrobium sp. 4228-Ro TaxID=2993937 RepID=UPI002248AF04|nr:ATP-dependent DNA helicase [Thermomicrobium sp. 4228-Ro]MCX2728342.1 ATP-dependent DNA helicase [Thermomicrobium sp. 4228-Ro]
MPHRLLESLTPEQQAVVTHESGPLLVIAGPGAGKTEVMLRRAAYLILERGVEPEGILLTTFTRKAAEELRVRLASLLGPQVERLLITTIHGFCQWLLEQFPDHHPFGQPLRILDEHLQHLFVFTHARALGLHQARGRFGDFIADVIAAFNTYSEDLVDPDALVTLLSASSDDPEALAVAVAYQRYRQLLDESGWLDFPGLQREAYRLLRDDDTVRAAVQARFEHVIVDEHQDTNVLQDLILGIVAAPETNLCVVGDDDQSIYRFRGATVANFLRFPELYPQARRIELSRNFRSTRPIVQVASRLIAHNPLRYAKAIEPVRGEGPEVLLLTSDDVDDEGERLAELIATLRAEGAIERWSDIAVLYRSVRYYAQPLLAALAARGIPAVAAGNGAFFDRPDIQQLRDLIVAFGWPASWRPDHFAGPILDFALETLERLAAFTGNIWELDERELAALGITDERERKLLASIIALQRRVKGKQHGSILTLVYEILARSKYVARCVERGDTRAVLNLAQFSRLAADFDRQERSAAPFRFGEFLRSLPERSLDELEPEDEDAVQVMTIHQAKGREFPVVVLASLVEGRLPGRERPRRFRLPPELLAQLTPPEIAERHLSDPEEALSDQRRLAYVALTRARDLLVLSAPARIRRQRCRPSRFLEEMGMPREPANASSARRFSLTSTRAQTRPRELGTSAIVTYATCPLRFFLLYEAGFELPVWPTVQLGQTIHLALAAVHREVLAGQPVDEDLAAHLFDRYWLPTSRLPSAQREGLYRTGREAVIRYVRHWHHTFERIVSVEQSFCYPTGHGVITGRIDLVRACPDGTLELVDFKTRATAGIALIRPDFQLRLYALAFERTTQRPVSRLCVHLLADDREESWAWTAHERAAIEAEVREIWDGIATRSFPPRPGSHCTACELAAFCPAAKGG